MSVASQQSDETETRDIVTSDNRKPINDKESNVMKTQTERAAMKPSAPRTERPPATRLRKVVFGGSPMKALKLALAKLEPEPELATLITSVLRLI